MARMTDKAQKALNVLVERMKKGDLGPITDVAAGSFDGGDRPWLHWSISNQFISYVLTGSMDCRGYRQWKEIGRYPTCSATAWILYPRIKKVEDDDGEEKEIFLGFGSAAVWGYNQTEGEPLYDPEALSPPQPPPLSDLADMLGIDVLYLPLPEDRLGDATVDGKRIRLGTQEVSVWFHELGHAIHARVVNGLGNVDRAHGEIVAELTAAALMDAYGYPDHSGNAWAYISKFAKDPIQAVYKAMGEVGEVIYCIYKQYRKEQTS